MYIRSMVYLTTLTSPTISAERPLMAPGKHDHLIDMLYGRLVINILESSSVARIDRVEAAHKYALVMPRAKAVTVVDCLSPRMAVSLGDDV